jgi:putative flippase GtrA
MALSAGQREFLRFCLVGVVGFVCDAGATLVLAKWLGISTLMARVIAFMSAATVTWALNRAFTFRHRGPGGEWLPYVLATGIGALISLGVYLIWLAFAGEAPLQLLIGVALGSVVALCFNFLVARRLIFRLAAPTRG